MRIETTGIHADTSAIRDSLETIGRQRGLVATPSNAADYYHNAMVHVRDGNHAAAEESFHAFFKLDDGNSFDAYIQYAKLVLGNYAQTRAKRLLGALAQNHPENLSAQVVMISETAEDDEQARTLLTKVIKEHGSFLPAFVCLKDRMPTGLLIDDIARDELRGAFRAAGGVEALKSFVLNPAEGEGRELLQNAKAFESEMAFDPMDRLIQGVQIDPNITLLWLGVDDPRPGREIVISFPGGVDVRLPLDSPDNPATEPGANGVLRGVAPGASVALELPRYVTGRKVRTPAFKPRDSNDVRIFPHAGELEGVEIDPNLQVAISYVDNKGRRYRFPKQVKLFGKEENGGGVFAVEIERRDSFDPTPVLQITPANSMSRVEVSGRAEGPFVPVPEHMNLPTMNEIACANVPFFAASSGSTKVWVRGTMENGEEIASLAIDLDVPPAVRWKTRELVSPKSSNAQSASSHELKFEPPDQYSDFYIDRLVFSPGGDRVAAMMERAGLVVWDVKTGRQTHLLEANTGKTLLFSADGARLTNGQVIVDLATSRASPFLQDSPDIFGVAVSQTFSAAATVDRYQRLAIYDSPFSHVSATVDLAYESVAPQILAVAPSADLIAVAGIRVHSVRLVDRAMGKIRKQLDVPYTGIASVAFSPDGKELLAVGSDSCVRLWNLATFTDRAARIALEDTKLEAFWTSNGMPLVAEHGKAGLTIYDAGTGKLFAKIDEPVKTFAISPTGTSIAIAKKTTVVIQRID
jgi:WD40 repeat protein